MRERLYRSRDDRMIFGVAGGMADWLDLDPAVVRLGWALLAILGGTGILLYIVAAIVIPEEPFETPAMTPQYQASTNPGPGTVPGAAGPGEAQTGAASASDAATGAGSAAVPPGAAWGAYYPQSRAERRAARRAARANRGPSSGGIVFGAILILVGVWFLLRDYIPSFDDRFVGPGILIAIGLLLLVAALRRNTPPTT